MKSMKRVALLGLALSGLVSVGAETPEWAKKEIEAAAKRYEAWKGNDETVTFVYVNDVHSYVDGRSDPPNYDDPKMHIPLAVQCADRVGADFFADLGDEDLEWAARRGEAAFDRRISDIQTLYSGCFAKRPVLFCVGNHEHCWGVPAIAGKVPVSNRAFGEAFNVLSVKAGHKLALSDDMSWGYYDVPGKKLRAFFLNSSDGELYYGLSPAQLTFVAEGLSSLEPGWQVVMLLHYCIDVTVGSTHGVQHCVCKNANVLIRMVEDFMWRAKGAEGGVSWDFTKADGLFAGFFCGDSHCSNQGERNFIHYTLSQGYGFSPNVPYGATSVWFDRSTTCFFEIVALKPAKAEARVFRVGSGGEAADRCYKYDRAGIEKDKRW